MSALDQAPLRGVGDEQGFIFIELVIALGLLVVVSLAIFAALDVMTRAQTRDQDQRGKDPCATRSICRIAALERHARTLRGVPETELSRRRPARRR